MELAEAIKQLSQQQSDGTYPVAILFGTITGVKPVVLKIDNQVYGSDFVVIPQHLTDYKVSVNVSGGFSGKTSSTTHTHSGGQHDGHTDGTGEHTHSGGSHSHEISSFSMSGSVMTVHNALKVGDKVIVARQNGGQKFVILDRIGV